MSSNQKHLSFFYSCTDTYTVNIERQVFLSCRSCVRRTYTQDSIATTQTTKLVEYSELWIAFSYSLQPLCPDMTRIMLPEDDAGCTFFKEMYYNQNIIDRPDTHFNLHFCNYCIIIRFYPFSTGYAYTVHAALS